MDEQVYILAADAAIKIGNIEKALEYLGKGLEVNPRSYEIFLMMGDCYLGKNINQAYLCYEQSYYYSIGTEDEAFVSSYLESFKEKYEYSVRPFSIIIVSYNQKMALEGCIDSIYRNNCKDTFEIIVVDNASTDGVTDYLRQQDIVLVCNEQNQGFGYACNQGIERAKKDNDIFFLNNDTIVTSNAIFFLRMGLYENEKVGATGSVSNYCGKNQLIDDGIESIDYIDIYAAKNNVLMKQPYEKQSVLSGFSLMIKREVLDKVGGFDLLYGKGYFEDADLCIRIAVAGYWLLICRNSFIFHYGSLSFREIKQEYNELYMENRKKFIDKWGFDFDEMNKCSEEAIKQITADKDAPIRVLVCGCGLGATMARIERLWPNSIVKGIERNENAVKVMFGMLDIEVEDAETLPSKTCEEAYDFVILETLAR